MGLALTCVLTGAAAGAILGGLVLSPFAMFVSDLAHFGFAEIRIWEVFTLRFLPWSLSFVAFGAVVGGFVGYLYGRAESRTRAAKTARDYLRWILDIQFNGIVALSPDLRILRANRAYAEHVGKDDPVGEYCYEVSHGLDRPCYEYGLDCPAKNVLDTDEPSTAVHTHGENDEQVLELHAFPRRNDAGDIVEITETIRDVTDRTRAENELEMSRERYRNLVEVSPVGIFRTNEDGDILYANPALVEIFGYEDAGELKEEGALDRYRDPKDRDAFLAAIKESGSVRDMEVEMVTKDGEVLNVLLSAVKTGNELSGFLIDVTELKRFNRALRMISRSNRCLVRADDEDKLMQEICNTAVEEGGYALAWIGYTNHDEIRGVRPVAAAGEEIEHLRSHRDRGLDDASAKKAVRTREPVRFGPETGADGTTTIYGVSLPLTHRKEIYGALTVHTSEPSAFGEEETEVLTELADDVAYGIHSLRTLEEKEAVVQDLREKEKKYRHLFENLTEAALIIDSETGRIREANRRAEELTGYLDETLFGLEVWDLHPPEEAEVYEESFRNIVDEEGVHEFDADLYTKTGDRTPISISASTVTLSEDRYVLGLFRDISDRKWRERKIKRQAEELEVLDRILRHNLRNEINVIIGNAELLEEQVEDPENREPLERILDTSTTILDRNEKARKVRDAYKRGVSGQKPVEVTETIHEEVQNATERYPHANIMTDLSGDLFVHSDELLGYAIRELIENAVEHSDRNHPTVHVTTLEDGDDVEIRVADDGPGIPKEEREPVMRGEETALMHASGIGLWLVKWFAELQGGELRFERNEPRGSIVTLRLKKA